MIAQNKAAKTIGVAQLLGIELNIPDIFPLAARELRSQTNISQLKAKLVPASLPAIEFADAWWLEKNGDIYIPQSVSFSQ